jgi:hypothetical protein
MCAAQETCPFKNLLLLTAGSSALSLSHIRTSIVLLLSTNSLRNGHSADSSSLTGVSFSAILDFVTAFASQMLSNSVAESY